MDTTKKKELLDTLYSIPMTPEWEPATEKKVDGYTLSMENAGGGNVIYQIHNAAGEEVFYQNDAAGDYRDNL